MSRTRLDDDQALIEHLVASTSLSASEAERVVGDVLAFYAEPVQSYVRRRHAELHRQGERNPGIFARVGAELAGRLVGAPVLTERQLRRIVYG